MVLVSFIFSKLEMLKLKIKIKKIENILEQCHDNVDSHRCSINLK